jgi:predicted transcriptional regulator
MDHDAFQREAESRFGTVGAAMTANVLTFEPETRASDAALQLAAAGVAGAPVLESGRVVGVLTLRDLLEREGHTASQMSGPFLRGERHLANLKVADVMTKEVVTAREEWPLTRAIEVMDAAGVSRLPVVDEADRSVGILARDDVLRAVARALREPPPTHPGAPRIEPN